MTKQSLAEEEDAKVGPGEEPPIALPELHQGTMDEALLRRFLDELAGAASSLELRVKDSARGKFRELSSLEELGDELLNRKVWGAQLAYRLGEERWMDTLLVRGDEFQLVRMCQDALPTPG